MAVHQKGYAASTLADTRSKIASIKSLNLLPNVLAQHATQAHGAIEAFFINEQGECVEGSTSNIFLAIDLVNVIPDIFNDF